MKETPIFDQLLESYNFDFDQEWRLWQPIFFKGQS